MAPQITEYTAPEGLGLRPSETGVHATEAAARRVGAAYSEIAQVTQQAGAHIGSAVAFAGQQFVDWREREEKKEVQQGAAAFAGLMNEKTKQWQAANGNADPNDPTVAKSFMDSVAGDVQKFKSGFITRGGQAWADHHVQVAMDHFYHKTSGDRATAAGHAVAINAEKAVNGHVNTVYNSGGDLETLKTSLANMATSGFSEKVVEAGRKQIIKAAALGGIDKNSVIPEWVNQKEYSQYINLPELNAIKKAETSKQTHDRVLANQQEAWTKKQNVEAVEKAAQDNDRDNSIYDPATNRYTFKPEYVENAAKIRDMPEGRAKGEAQMRFLQSQQDKKPPPIRDDPNVHNDLLNRLTDPSSANHPTTDVEIYTAAAEGHLTSKTTQQLIHLYNASTQVPRDPALHSVLNAASTVIGKDPVGAVNYNNFRQDFLPKYMAARRANALQPNALDINDPKSLVRQSMEPALRSSQQKMIDNAMHATPIEPGTPAAPPPSGGRPAVPAPAPTTPPSAAIPPSAERVLNKVYMLPSGPHKWVVDGWLPVPAAPAVPMSR